MHIALGTDHAGFEYKEALRDHLLGLGHEVSDFGCETPERCDYPDFVFPAAAAVAEGVCDRAIVLGGSGNGEAMAANRIPGVRCALVWNVETARLSREHNDANCISIGARMIDLETAKAIVDTWLATDFEGGRHIARIAKLDDPPVFEFVGEEAEPGPADELIAEGQRLTDEGLLDDALATFDRAILTDPESGYAWFCKGCTLGQLERHDEAITAYQRCAEIAPDRSLPWYNMGNSMQLLERWADSIEAYDHAIELEPGDPDAWVNKGRSLDEIGKSESAVTCYDRALELNPEDDVAWANRGNSLRKLGRYEEAEASYLGALRIDRADPRALFGLARALLESERFEDALDVLDEAVRSHDSADGWCSRGIALSRLDRHEEALESFQRAAALAPEEAAVWNDLGEVHGRLNLWEEAIPHFDRALEVVPEYPPALFGRARACFELGRAEEATRDAKRFLELVDPADDLVDAARLIVNAGT